MTNETIRVLLVDDHRLIRETISRQLERAPGFTVVGTASDAEEAIELTRRCQPHVVVMDIDMPGLICFDATERIRATQPEVRILFLSAFVHDHYIENALRVGALGYLTKNASPEELMTGIREVAANRACFSREIQSRIVFDSDHTRLAEHGKSRASTLTRREVEVLRYIARGLAKKRIAETMHVSTKTVEKHTENLMSKLGIHDRVELARYAIREGLVEP